MFSCIFLAVAELCAFLFTEFTQLSSCLGLFFFWSYSAIQSDNIGSVVILIGFIQSMFLVSI